MNKITIILVSKKIAVARGPGTVGRARGPVIHHVMTQVALSERGPTFYTYCAIIILKLQLCVRPSVRTGGDWKPFDPS